MSTEGAKTGAGGSRQMRRVALLFAGGPAPAANAVISTSAMSFLDHGVDVIGILYGYSNLQEFGTEKKPKLVEGQDYIQITRQTVKRARVSQGVLIGTSRENPGRCVDSPEDLKDPEKVAPLKRVYDALCSLNVDALVSIGGDDTLKTANKLRLYQQQYIEPERRIPIVHVPKTIDNDYRGIDFTFGYFTAVEVLGTEVRNLVADAESSRSYFIVETMGRSAGWLAYGAAIAGEASLVISVEDLQGDLLSEETVEIEGKQVTRKIMNLDKVLDWIVKMMLTREKHGKYYGVVVLAEGLAKYMPWSVLKGVKCDPHGHPAVAEVQLARRFAKLVAERYKQKTGRSKKITGVQLGYESRCARPHAYDVMLGSQLGVGAFRALYEEGLDGVMISVRGQLELVYVPFDELVDPKTLKTVVRFVEPGSDFHRLARFLEMKLNE